MYPKTRMRRLRREILRPIFTETRLSPDAFCLPLFFDETAEEEIPISSMPGQVRYPLSAAEPLARKLYAEGVITAKVDDIITVALTIHESETEFLNYYNGMTVELTWE